MSMHLKNSRDMLATDEIGWWASKTSLEQKLIVLSSILFILSFCLVISVIVINNRKPASGKVTTVEPAPTDATTQPTEPTQSEGTPSSTVITESPSVASTETDKTTNKPTDPEKATAVTPENEDKDKGEGENKDKDDKEGENKEKDNKEGENKGKEENNSIPIKRSLNDNKMTPIEILLRRYRADVKGL